jgi:hypothetical protein
MEPSQAAVARVASYLIEQVDEAKLVIANSQLADEAKHGVQDSLFKVATAFSLAGINGAPKQYVPDVAGAISNLVILLSASGIETQARTPKEAEDLAKEVEGLIQAFDDPGLDPVVRDLGKQHLQILATMLRHVSIFGVEAAMATYFELVIKVRRADANTTPEQKAATSPLMDKINGWGKALTALDKAYNQGARWFARGKIGLALLGFIDPGSAA